MTYDRLRTQARLQLHHRMANEHIYEVLDPALRPEIGFGALSAPSPHDIFWDLEGNPFSEDGGIEYLWGITDREDNFTAVWAHDHHEEKKAVEATIDRFITLREQHPDAHIYHYAHHEETTLKRRPLGTQLAKKNSITFCVLMRSLTSSKWFVVLCSAVLRTTH